METKYNNGGFAPNKGVYDCLDDVTAHRARLWNSQLYKKLNTIKTESFICKDGPFEGQTLELSNEDESKSAIFTVGKWHGRYVSGQWVSMNENEDVSSLQKIETKATAHNYGNMGKGYEKLGQFIDDIFCNESELPAFTKYKFEKKSIEDRSHCTDDFGNVLHAIELIDEYGSFVRELSFKPLPQYAIVYQNFARKNGKKIKQKNYALTQKIDRYCDSAVMVDDFGELFKPIGVFNQYEHEYYKPIAQFKTFTIGGQAFTIKADHESRENFIKKIVKAKKWFADKSLSRPVSLDSKIKQMQMEEIAIAATQGHIKPNDLNHFERVRMHQANKALLHELQINCPYAHQERMRAIAKQELQAAIASNTATIEPTPPIQIATLNEFDFIVTKFGANQAYSEALANRVPFSGIRSRFQYPIIQTEPEPPIHFEPVATEPTPPIQIETATTEPTPPIQSETEIDIYITAKIAELKTKASKCRLHDRPAWAEKIDAVITQLQASLQPKPPTNNPTKPLASTCQRKARARIPWPKYICTTKIGFGHKMDAPMPASPNNAKNLVDYSP